MKKKNASTQHAYLKKVGQNIRQARKERGMSQEALALEAGLDRSYVGGVERGDRNIAIANLKKLADALRIRVSELVEGL